MYNPFPFSHSTLMHIRMHTKILFSLSYHFYSAQTCTQSYHFKDNLKRDYIPYSPHKQSCIHRQSVCADVHGYASAGNVSYCSLFLSLPGCLTVSQNNNHTDCCNPYCAQRFPWYPHCAGLRWALLSWTKPRHTHTHILVLPGSLLLTIRVK